MPPEFLKALPADLAIVRKPGPFRTVSLQSLAFMVYSFSFGRGCGMPSEAVQGSGFRVHRTDLYRGSVRAP